MIDPNLLRKAKELIFESRQPIAKYCQHLLSKGRVKLLGYDQARRGDHQEILLYWNRWSGGASARPGSSHLGQLSGEYPFNQEDLLILNREYMGYQLGSRIYLSTNIKTSIGLARTIVHEMVHYWFKAPAQYSCEAEILLHETAALIGEFSFLEQDVDMALIHFAKAETIETYDLMG